MRAAFLVLSVVGFTFLAGASQPVATVSSESSFEIDGTMVRGLAVPSWPLMAGDTLVSNDAPLSISLRDGSRITLAANSHLRLEPSAQGLTASLTSGSMQFTLAPGSSLRVVKGGTLVGGRSGAVSVGGDPSPEKIGCVVCARACAVCVSLR